MQTLAMQCCKSQLPVCYVHIQTDQYPFYCRKVMTMNILFAFYCGRRSGKEYEVRCAWYNAETFGTIS